MAKVESLRDSPLISALVRYEFQQAMWFKVWLQARGLPQGLTETAAQSALAAFELDLEEGPWVVSLTDWESVVSRAERLTFDHTPRHGARTMDLLHLATALQLGATELLSFDENQRRSAVAAGLLAGP